MHVQRKLLSFKQFPFSTATAFEFGNGFQKPLGVFRAPGQISSFFKRLVIIERKQSIDLRHLFETFLDIWPIGTGFQFGLLF